MLGSRVGRSACANSRTQQPFRSTPPCARHCSAQHKRNFKSTVTCRAVWDESMTLAQLRKELDTAVKQEDYALAANLRDTLQ